MFNYSVLLLNNIKLLLKCRLEISNWFFAKVRMIKDILSVLNLLPTINRWKSLLFMLNILASSLLPVGIAILTGLLIGSIPPAIAGGFESEAGQITINLLIALAGLILLLRVLAPLRAAQAISLGRDVDRYLQELMMEAVGRPPGIAHLENEDILDRLRLVRSLGINNNRPGMAIESLAALLPAWLQALGAAALLFWFQWWLGLAWLVAWPVLVYFMQREYIKVGQVGYGQSGALRRAEYFRDLAFTAPAAKEIRIWGMLDWLLKGFESAWLSAIKPVWKARRPSVSIIFGTSAAVMGINLISYGLLVWAAIRADLSLAALAIFIQALDWANGYTAFNDDNANLSFAAVAVPKVLELNQMLQPGLRSENSELPAQSPLHELRFENVTFHYPGAERNALDQLTLQIPAGRSLAIVGENGAGKTTLVKLLCGLYAPTAGSITVDGIALNAVNAAAWRRKVAVLFQDFTRYHLSARANIAYGAPELAHDFDRLQAAAAKAGALELIQSLPQNWDTILSSEYTHGVDLSGGQWQRIALARTLFAVEAGARVLILDEPTAALDVRAEADLYNRFLQITQGLTTILISHRFSTVRRADAIIVMADGRMIEQGQHTELLAQSGQYATMFHLQAARFSDTNGNQKHSDGDAAHA
jgi:ATP-binding cassette, subfamily B, bacterial